MEAVLKKQAIAAVGWSSVEAFARQGLQFLFSVILARLLLPEEFGVVAMISLFTLVAGVFADGGFSAALIQKRNLTIDDTSSVFYFNVGMGLMVALMMVAAAPWIAAFYRVPVLMPLTRFLALNLFLGTFGAVHTALLLKDLDFGTLTRISVSAATLSGIAAVFLAWRGWGVWSLAVQGMISTVISVLLLWIWRPWRPALRFSSVALGSLFRFGSYLFVSGLLDTVFNRLYTLVIGRVYSARQLGFYTRADTTQQVPVSLMATVVDRVMFPLLSSANGDRKILRSGVRKAVAILMLVNIPVCLGLAVVSRSLVLVLFGEKWSPCIQYLQVLCLGGLVWPLHIANLSVLKAMGRSDLFFRVEVIKKILGFSTLIVASTISVLAMAWSGVVLGVICFFLNAYYVGTLLGYPALSQLRDTYRSFLAGGGMAVCVWAVRNMLSGWSEIGLLAMMVLAGALTYNLFSALLGIEAYRQLMNMAKERMWGLASMRSH
jgi:O-antigen/teichoic acid export membrane protein